MNPLCSPGGQEFDGAGQNYEIELRSSCVSLSIVLFSHTFINPTPALPKPYPCNRHKNGFLEAKTKPKRPLPTREFIEEHKLPQMARNDESPNAAKISIMPLQTGWSRRI